MVFTVDQEDALINMTAWFNNVPKSNDDFEYTLNGSAGSGKTTIIKEFLKRITVNKASVGVSAPTHKAKKQIEEATGYTGTTIQKVLGLRPNTDLEYFNINRPQFSMLAKPTINSYKLLIIDESSMLNSGLYTFIKNKSIKHKVKVLYVGDSYQLPPVKERVSRVFTAVRNKSVLTTIVRQGKDNPMADILLALREDIKKNTSKGIELLLANPNSIIGEKGYQALKSEGGEFGGKMLNYFLNTEYSFNNNYMKFITWTNDNVLLWSEGIRKNVLGEKSNNLLNIDEVLLSYSSIIEKNSNQLIIENSAEYKVTHLQKGTSKFGISGYNVTLLDDENNARTVFIVDKDGIDDFRLICNEKHSLAMNKRGSYWKSFYSFKHSHLLLENVYKDPDKPKARWNLLCKKDLYYNYGLTTHKSQGSTYENVAVNLNNLFLCKEESTRARLIYVALSRAKNMNLIMLK